MRTDDNFSITEIDNDKKQYLPLLLIGDESETMINRYLDNGTLYVGLFNGKPIAVCVTVNLDPNTVEIKILPSKPNTDGMDTVVGCLNMSNLDIQIKRSFSEPERRHQH